MYLSNSVLYINRALAYRECPERTEDDYTIECHIPAQNDNLMDMFEPASDYTMNLTLTSSIGEVSRIYHIPVAQNGTATKNIHYNNYKIYENRSTLYIYACNISWIDEYARISFGYFKGFSYHKAEVGLKL